MSNMTLYFIVAVVFLSASAQACAQSPPSTTQKGSPAQHQAPYEVQLAPKVAEALLIHKEEPACQKDSDGVKIMATVIVAITVDESGKVIHTQTISGPKLLQPLALATARKYIYKPYLLKNAPVEFETVVSIQINCFFHSGQA